MRAVIICFLCLATACFAGPSYLWLKSPASGGNTIGQRFAAPEGCQRVVTLAGSFGEWLRGLPLKPGCPPVHLYNGRTRYPAENHAAVVDMDVGRADLQQCADTVIRLRTEYLYSRKQYAAIHFNFSNGFRADYTKWARGYRIAVRGNRVSWAKTAKADNSHTAFRAYLNVVFTYAGTASLSKELVSVKVEQMRIGDVFIHGGFPGHVEMVVDMATNPRTGKKYFLLAQGFMPAQEAHVVKNLHDTALSPWYPLDFGQTLHSPEWDFGRGELKRFR